MQCCSNHQISSFPFLTLGCLISIKLIYSDTVTWSSSHFNISYLPEAKARQLLRQPFCHPGSRVFGCIHTGHCCCNTTVHPPLPACTLAVSNDPSSRMLQHVSAASQCHSHCLLLLSLCTNMHLKITSIIIFMISCILRLNCNSFWKQSHAALSRAL